MRLAIALLAAASLAGCTKGWDTSNTATADTKLARDTATDARRHGPEIAAFAGLKAGDKVIDWIPGGGYWTRTFSRIVGPSGHVYGIWAKPYAQEAGTDVRNYTALAADPAFGNISASIQPATELKAAEPVDLVFTSQNYHDYADKFMGSLDPAILNKAAFAALKPGGIFLIIDHAAAAGSGMRDTDTLHRIDPDIVKKQVTAAGFTFVGESRLLANPADDKTKAVFDKSVRGKTDQFIYKFKKP
ncbi:class I SAM-dependent methyltransferase [Sphingomonas panacisoli]|uniref:Class I SAM-dependent methyltransferase n=1 Tax=Sphingomonas panacisoli TaxID=1813879 RepID=A0A5B8LMT4_9SPHN|nr:class I SAM-dependent methyltransferase [Sphingomonas panacisoli]QDZ08904.1 class I SAM-dependent methyltransferase [Sphingomonas panacisoli]